MPAFSITDSRFYLYEVQYQTEAFLGAFNEMHAYSRKELEDDEVAPYQRLAFRSMQSMIMAAGLLSKLFWVPDLPKEKKSSAREIEVNTFGKARASFLRDLCKISNDSPLKKREVRNAYEHLDHRLDRMISKGTHFASIASDVADLDGSFFGGTGTIFRNRYFDRSTNILTVANTEVAMPPLYQEVVRLASTLAELRENPPFGVAYF